ncbi:MAG: GNAT family N-acetyltransferase [Acidimicrobiales bacterium]
MVGLRSPDAAAGAVLDRLLADAWPALVEERDATWRFRWTNGVTSRGSSALAVGGNDHLDRLVARAEAFYAVRSSPARILVSDASAPPGLAGHLAARGYSSEKLTLVMVAATADVRERMGIGGGGRGCRVTAAVDDEWFDAYWSVESARGRVDRDAAIYREVLLAGDRPQRFVAATTATGDVVGTAQGVLDAGWCGVQCMTTRSTHLRRGVASTVLAILAAEASAAGAHRMYLAVQADNAAAVSLYGRAGFRPAHRYRYMAGAVGTAG